MPDSSPLLASALAHHQSGDLAEALRLYKDILASDPVNADALHMMGVIAKQKGNNELALKMIEAALGQRSSMPLAWHNRSLLLRMLGRNDEALQSALQAVDLDPSMAEAWDMIGFLRREKRDYENARDAHAEAVKLQPGNLKFLNNYALLLLATGDLTQAYAIARDVEKRDPDLVSQTLGNILKAAGYTDRALRHFRKSCEILPNNAELQSTEAMARLQVGDFAEGWKIWETRPSLDPLFAHLPFWNGQAVDHLLLHEDQGIGDALQCARYIPELRRYAKRVTIQVKPALTRLFKASFPDCNVLNISDPVPAADARIRMLSLPGFFGANEKNIPTPIPYLRAEKQWQQEWHDRLATIAKPRIGIVWGGNPEHLNDAQRSIPFNLFEPMFAAGNAESPSRLREGLGVGAASSPRAAHFVSLQKGSQKNGIDLARYKIFDADRFLKDFADTAGLIAELDLLISVDTSVVHMAGALGKPVWLLLPFDADWRWLIGREDSPWYPTLRLFRQQKPRDWPEVIARVAADLGRLLAGDRSILQPAKQQGACLRENPMASRVLSL